MVLLREGVGWMYFVALCGTFFITIFVVTKHYLTVI
jgi:hypothetical protein